MDPIQDVPGLESQIGQIPGLEQQQATAQAKASGPDRARLDAIDTDISQTYKREGEASQDRQMELAGRERFIDQIDANAPQDNIKHVMQQSPLFMALAALAGGGFKSSAVTGLSAMNGMVQGMVKGDRQAYEDQWDEYKRQIESMRMKFELRDQTYEEIKNNFALTHEGQMHAWQIANAALSMDQADADRSYAQRTETMKLWQKAYLQYKQMENARNIAAGHDVAIEHSADVRASAVSGKAAQAKANQSELLTKIDNTIDDLISQIQKHPKSTGLLGKGRGALEAVGVMDSTASADVQAQANQLALLVAQYDKAGGRPSTFLLKQIEDIAGPNAQPLTTDKNAISRLQQLKTMIKGERAHPDTQYDSLQDLQSAVEAGNIDRNAAIQIATENNWISGE